MAAAALALTATTALAAKPKSELLYVGTQATGAEQGLYGARLDPATGKLTALGRVADLAAPFWIASQPRTRVLFAGNAGPVGKPAQMTALTFDPDTGKLQTLGQVEVPAAPISHLAYDARSRTLFVANFGAGAVSVLPVAADGRLSPPATVAQDRGSGPTPRQAGPHPHEVVLDPTGRYLVVPDFGADRLFVYRFDPARRSLSPTTPEPVALPPGSGPRRVVFLPGGRFVLQLSELSADLRLYRWDARAGTLSEVERRPLDPPDFKGTRSGAEMLLSPDGRHVYVSNRGDNTLIVYAIDGAAGSFREEQRLASPGKTPWTFAFDRSGRWMVVANQGSDQLSVLKVDRKTGALMATGESLSVPKPVALSFPD